MGVLADERRAVGLEAGQRQSRRAGFWRRYIRHRLALGGMGFLIIIGLAALFAPWISPYDPYTMQLPNAGLDPSVRHPLGTDDLGRDLATRVLYGGRVSIAVALLAVAISTTIGTLFGTISGFRGGWVDAIIMRFTDVLLAVPLLLFLIVMATILGPSPVTIVVLIGLFNWMGTARLVRGQVLSVKNEQYVEAARASGAKSGRIITRHILPNTIAPIIVVSTLGVASAMLSEAALSFLGLGIQPPIPTWGNLLNAARQLQVLAQEPWLWIGPGAAITLTVLSVNFMGDGLRDALDPRHQS